MRQSLPTLLFVALLAVPLQAQICRKVPPPFLPSLLPERVADMPLEFVTDPGGGCTSRFRPEGARARATEPWAMVSLEANTEGSLGEWADSIRSKFDRPNLSVLTLGDWPVVYRQLVKGDEFVAYKGSVKVTVLIKNGDNGPASEALATRLFERILPKVPCG